MCCPSDGRGGCWPTLSGISQALSLERSFDELSLWGTSVDWDGGILWVWFSYNLWVMGLSGHKSNLVPLALVWNWHNSVLCLFANLSHAILPQLHLRNGEETMSKHSLYGESGRCDYASEHRWTQGEHRWLKFMHNPKNVLSINCFNCYQPSSLRP